MADPLAQYKAFIDALVQRSPSVEARRMRERTLIELPSEQEREKARRQGYTEALAQWERFAKYNKLLEDLTDEQRHMIADLLGEEKQTGIAEVLTLLTDGGYTLSREGEALPFEPFDTPYDFDFVARLDGDSWPDERSDKGESD